MTIKHFQIFNQCNISCSFQISLSHLLPCLDIEYKFSTNISSCLEEDSGVEVHKELPPEFSNGWSSQLLYVTYVAAAGRSPSYLQPLCGCIQSNSVFPLNVLCRRDRQADSKINTTLRTVGLAQTDVGPQVRNTKLDKTKIAFKNPSGKEEKQIAQISEQ